MNINWNCNEINVRYFFWIDIKLNCVTITKTIVFCLGVVLQVLNQHCGCWWPGALAILLSYRNKIQLDVGFKSDSLLNEEILDGYLCKSHTYKCNTKHMFIRYLQIEYISKQWRNLNVMTFQITGFSTFVQKIIQATIIDTITKLRIMSPSWGVCGGFSTQRTGNAENVSKSWYHHGRH